MGACCGGVQFQKQSTSTPLPFTTTMLMGCVQDSGNGSTQGFRINGGAENTGTTDRSTANPILALGNHGAADDYFDGLIAEVIVINAILNATDRQKVEGYLAHKWGLTAELPADHPYKFAAPDDSIAITSLEGAVADADDDTVTTSWSLLDGPAPVSFNDPSLTNATVTFTMIGLYTLALTADDGRTQTWDQVSVTVDEPVCYTITATAGPNGSIAPSGDIPVQEGCDQSFSITPALGCAISNVLVDGASVGAVSTYTFAALGQDHTISAELTIGPAPVVEIVPGAVPVSETASTLTGILTTGLAANAWICWGTNDGGTNSTNDWEHVASMGAVTENSTFSTVATGLVANTSYWYRCYVDSYTGNDWSDDAGLFHSGDADGDGISDHLERTFYFTDPLVADVPAPSTWSEVASATGNQVVNSQGDWVVEPGSIFAAARGGYVEYEMSVPTDGYFAVEIHVAEHNPLFDGAYFDLSLYVDGRDAGRQVISQDTDAGKGIFVTPWLSSGSHTIRVLWNDFTENSILEILQIRILDLGGADIDQNGRPDWMDTRLRNTAALDAAPDTSIVSPICLEGTSLEMEKLHIAASYIPEDMIEQTITARRTLGQGWFADVLLSPTNETLIAVTDQDGRFTATNRVDWVPVNILEGTYTNVLVREGSSMLLTAYPTNGANGTVELSVYQGTNVITNTVTDTETPFLYAFEIDGDYTVTASFSNTVTQTNAAMNVRVRGGGFAPDPAAAAGVTRDWMCPLLPSEVVIEHDDDLTAIRSDLPDGGLGFRLTIAVRDERYIIARLGEDGPILDVAKVTGILADIDDALSIDTVTMIDSYTQIISTRLNIGPTIPEGTTVTISIWPAGLTFDDGTRERTITADDFNEFGEYRYSLIRPLNTPRCHFVTIFSHGEDINGVTRL